MEWVVERSPDFGRKMLVGLRNMYLGSYVYFKLRCKFEDMCLMTLILKLLTPWSYLRIDGSERRLFYCSDV